MNIKFLSENLAGQFAKSLLAKCVKQEERVAHCGLHIIIIIVTAMQCNGLRMHHLAGMVHPPKGWSGLSGLRQQQQASLSRVATIIIFNQH